MEGSIEVWVRFGTGAEPETWAEIVPRFRTVSAVHFGFGRRGRCGGRRSGGWGGVGRRLVEAGNATFDGDTGTDA